MSIFEYDERREKKKLLRMERKYARLEGIEEGLQKGRKQGVAQGIIKIGREVGWSEDKILEKLQAELLISQEEAKHYFAKVPS